MLKHVIICTRCSTKYLFGPFLVDDNDQEDRNVDSRTSSTDDADIIGSMDKEKEEKQVENTQKRQEGKCYISRSCIFVSIFLILEIRLSICPKVILQSIHSLLHQ